MMVIFSPGPANISERVRKALAKPDISHRGLEFEKILANVRNMIRDVMGIPGEYEVIMLGGSGTSAIESVVSAFGRWDRKILIISNGIYGERASAIASRYDIAAEEIRFKWGDLPDLDLIDKKLEEDVFGAVYVVHHETTTGILNPLKEIASIGRRHGKLVLTDAVSSIAGEELDMAGWGVDAAIGSANKCIRGVPGIAFVVAGPRFIDAVSECSSRSYYTDLLLHHRSELNGQTPFTPPVQAYYALEEALKELGEEGVGRRIEKYKETARILRDGAKALGLKFLLPEKFMSNTMTTIYTPVGKTYSQLHDSFKKEGFVIYASQGELREKTFRLGTVGVISRDDINRFLKIFEDKL